VLLTIDGEDKEAVGAKIQVQGRYRGDVAEVQGRYRGGLGEPEPEP